MWSEWSKISTADWAAAAAVFSVVVAVFAHVWTTVKDRRQRHVEAMLKFATDFYNDEQLASMFLDIQANRLEIESLRKLGSPQQVALSHLLDYLNTIGIGLERRLLTVKAIAATSIAFIVLTTSRNAAVTAYIADIQGEHNRLHIPSPGWPEFENMAQRLAAYAIHRPHAPDLRPWYTAAFDPFKSRDKRRINRIKCTPYDWTYRSKSFCMESRKVESGKLKVFRLAREATKRFKGDVP